METESGRVFSVTDRMNTCTFLLRLLAHAPISDHEPLLQYKRPEVNCNMYNIGTNTFSIISQNTF